MVATVMGGLIGTEPPPPADPTTLRALLTDLGLRPGQDLAATVRTFQARAGLNPDGVAGPRTVHALVRSSRVAA